MAIAPARNLWEPVYGGSTLLGSAGARSTAESSSSGGSLTLIFSLLKIKQKNNHTPDLSLQWSDSGGAEDVSSPVQLHELSAGVGHMVHLQVCGSAEHPRDHARGQREPGGVHEVEQQGDAGRVQGVRERHGAEMLLTAPTTPLKQHAVGVQRVEEPAEDRGREYWGLYEEYYKTVWFGLLNQPAGHKHGAVCTQLHTAHNQGGVSQNAAVSKFVQVQQHIAGVARKLLHVSHNRGSDLHLGSSVHPVRFQFIHHSDLRREGQMGRGGIIWFACLGTFILK